MTVHFKTPINWLDFYRLYGLELDPENEQGWASVDCPLKSHPRYEKKQSRAAVNSKSGSYKCWSEKCREHSKDLLNKSSESQILTPREFIQLTQGFGSDEAAQVVESYRLQFGDDPHFDEFRGYYTPSQELQLFTQQAQMNLTYDHPLVVEYCQTRGIRFQTLRRVGAGIVLEEDEQEECLVLPYIVNGQVVGLRGRTIDGRKGGIRNSYNTLYLLDDLDFREARVVVLVEGETDTLYTRDLLDEHGFEDIPVLGTPGASFDIEWSRHFQGRSRVIAIPQADEAARRWVKSLYKSFGERLDIVSLPWPTKSQGKDVSDFGRLGDEHRETLLSQMALEADDTETPHYSRTPTELIALAQEGIPWVIENLVESGTKTLIVGEPKTKKTWIVLQMARCVTMGGKFLGYDGWEAPDLGRVLLVEEEGSPHRLGERLQLMGLENDDLRIVHRQGVRLDDPDSLGRLRSELIQFKPSLLILDPYSLLHSQDENTAQGTMIVVSAMNNLLRAVPRMALVLVHHTAKGGDGPRGSGSLWGAMDTQIQVTRRGRGIKLKVLGRDLIDDDLDSLLFQFNSETGQHYQTESRAGEQVHSQMNEKALREAILDSIGETWKGVSEIFEVLGGRWPRGLVRETLKDLVELQFIERRGEGRRGDPVRYRKIIDIQEN